MRRNLVTLCSAVSLFVCIVVCGLWLETRREGLQAQYFGRGDWLLVHAGDDRLTVLVNTGSLWGPERRFGWSRGGDGRLSVPEFLDLDTMLHVGQRVEQRRWAGAEWYFIDSRSGGGVTRVAVVPLPYLLPVTLLPPLGRLVAAVRGRGRGRRRSGLCPACGSTIERCPECGAAGKLSA